ncbi:Elongation factor 2 [Entamoeba marina]
MSVNQYNLHDLYCNQNNIRNICIISSMGHGRRSLIDNYITYFENYRQDDVVRMHTIQPVSCPMYYEFSGVNNVPKDANGNGFLVNLIGSPSTSNLPIEIAGTLRLTDGALVVVDCIKGIEIEIETTLRKALDERVQFILFINKIDKLILESQQSFEEMYQTFDKYINHINTLMSTCYDEHFEDMYIHPKKGSIAFGSGIHGWAFTLEQFAEMWSKKYGISKEKMINTLWGDNYWDGVSKCWKKNNKANNGGLLQRCFVQFCLEPISKLCNAVIEGRHEDYGEMLKNLNIELPGGYKDKEGIELVHIIMKSWLPINNSLLKMVVVHLPSPVIAQKYKIDNLYTGDLNDETAIAMKNCDPNGPLMIHISKMVPSNETSRLYAFGRVFSGTVKTGSKIRICSNEYIPKQPGNCHIKHIQRTALMMGIYVELIDECPCGNVVGLVGVDQYISKSGTITDSDTSHIIKEIKFTHNPIICVSVEPKDPSNLPKLVEGMKRLSKIDPLCSCFTEETGEHIIAGITELHVNALLEYLQENNRQKCLLNVSKPFNPFKETIRKTSSMICLSKSANKHNRLLSHQIWMLKKRANILANKYDWDVYECRKIWCFGPDNIGPNILVDDTKGIQYLNEIKDSVILGFNHAMNVGAICGEQVRGVRINLMDVMMQADAIHRGYGQIVPCAYRCCNASILTASPTLSEPIYLTEIRFQKSVMSVVYSALARRRAIILSKEQHLIQSLMDIKAYLPVVESFGFLNNLQTQTNGKVSCQLHFSHWQIMDGDIDDSCSYVNQIIMQIRKRKGLSEAIPTLDMYNDKL